MILRRLTSLLGPVALLAILAFATPTLAQEKPEAMDAPEPAKQPLFLRIYDVSFMDVWGDPEDRLRDGVPALRAAPEAGLAARAFRLHGGLGADPVASEALYLRGLPRVEAQDASHMSFETWADWIEQALGESAGNIEYMDGTVLAFKSQPDHDRIARYLSTLAPVMARQLSIEVRAVALPVADPGLFASDSAALALAAERRGRVVFTGVRTVRRGVWPTFQAVERTAVIRSARPDPAPETIPTGFELNVAPLAADQRGRVHVRIRATETTLDRLDRVRAQVADVDLPTVGERSAWSLVALEDGARAAIALGPRGPDEVMVVTVGVSLRPSSAPEQESGSNFRIFDISGLGHPVRLPASPAEESHRGMGGYEPEMLIDVLKQSTGGDEVWADGTRIDAFGMGLQLWNTPEVLTRSAALLAELTERRRPRRLDAWLLRAAAGPLPPAGALDAAAAERLLARAAARDGLELAGRFGGGVAINGAGYFRSRVQERYIGSVEPSGEGAKEPGPVPLACAVDSGLALEASLESSGLTPTAGVALRAALVAQQAGLEREAQAPLGDGDTIAIRLPSIRRREIRDRIALPAGGGWALMFGESPAKPGQRLALLVRVGP